MSLPPAAIGPPTPTTATTTRPSAVRGSGARTGSTRCCLVHLMSFRACSSCRARPGTQVLFYPRFDHIVLLSAPAEVLAERLATRATNPYGKDPAELAETLEYGQLEQS